MGYKDISSDSMLAVIVEVGDDFSTKDISEHPDMLKAHPYEATRPNYHAEVGKALKRLTNNREELVLAGEFSHHPRGWRWHVRPGTLSSQERRTIQGTGIDGQPVMGIDRSVLIGALGSYPDHFSTLSVTNDSAMKDTHANICRNRFLYRTMVENALRGLRDANGQPVLDASSGRGPSGEIRWRKIEGVGAPVADVESVDTAIPTMEEEVGGREDSIGSIALSQNEIGGGLPVGPQYAGDNSFTARMRFHQSDYRARVLKVPFGTGPTPGSPNPYGNMLNDDDGTRGLNFLSPVIFEVARQRMGGGGVVEGFRLLNNMLSSQPMCFNLFGLQVRDLDLATRLWRAVFPDEVDRVTRVMIEFAPEPRSAYLNDNTAFDAFVEYKRTSGELAFLGIETKLTEPFSRKVYDRDTYRRWMQGAASPWRMDADDRVADVHHNQLWRDHLLAIALLQREGSSYVAGRFLIVRHPADRECTSVVKGYQSLLRERDETFVDLPLDKLVAAWEPVLAHDDERLWLSEFRRRYLDLECTEAAWRKRR